MSAENPEFGWSVLGHAETLAVITDHETFSNVVSTHLSVPNGMDPPVHTPYRAVIDRYFTPERMAAFEPVCRREVAALVETALAEPAGGDFMVGFADPFALSMQSAFLGWPESIHEPLAAWMQRSHVATRHRDRDTLAALATEFDGHIRRMLDARREAAPSLDITAELLHEEVDGRRLTDEEIVSILRNWTVGELGTIAASVGILAHHLAVDQALQQRLRGHPEELPIAIDEILRIHGPLVTNRRVATRDVTLGGQPVTAGDRVTVVWVSANRDDGVFGDPDEFRMDRDPTDNLLYGAGVHVCPGAPLARLEMRVAMEELLARTSVIRLAGEPVHAVWPAGGFDVLPLTLE